MKNRASTHHVTPWTERNHWAVGDSAWTEGTGRTGGVGGRGERSKDKNGEVKCLEPYSVEVKHRTEQYTNTTSKGKGAKKK